MWIARDKNGCLYLYEAKPQKFNYRDIWDNDGNGAHHIDDALFPEVKWEDEEPTEVDIVPKNNQREKHEELKSIDWEQRRYEIARESLTAIMSNIEFYKQVLDDGKNGGVYSIPINVSMAAVDFADALIEELRKGE